MSATPVITRQSWACPYEALPPESMRDFVHPPTPAGYEGPPLTVCPGYTTSLPDTIYLARAWGWAERGELRTFCNGQAPDAVIDGVDIFAGAVGEFRDYECSTCKAERKS